MKTILEIYSDHVDVVVIDKNNKRIHVYTFDNRNEAEAFFTGFRCCQQLANSLIQSIPTIHTTEYAFIKQ